MASKEHNLPLVQLVGPALAQPFQSGPTPTSVKIYVFGLAALALRCCAQASLVAGMGSVGSSWARIEPCPHISRHEQVPF